MDITATQFRVLCSIRCEVCTTPVELKTVLSVDPGAMTRMLDRLVCKGWIERLPNPNDKRGILVQLTQKAQPFVSTVIRLWVKNCTRN